MLGDPNPGFCRGQFSLRGENRNSRSFQQRPKLIFALRNVPNELLERKDYAKKLCENFIGRLDTRYKELRRQLDLNDQRDLEADFLVGISALPLKHLHAVCRAMME